VNHYQAKLVKPFICLVLVMNPLFYTVIIKL
jgi:hypothetical protein